MVDRKHAAYTQVNNVVGNLNLLYAIAEIKPEIHLVNPVAPAVQRDLQLVSRRS
jgi:nucleoside-diphosphate-sugar epimerase